MASGWRWTVQLCGLLMKCHTKLNARVKCTVTSHNVFGWNLMLIIFGQILLRSTRMVILNTCWVCCEIWWLWNTLWIGLLCLQAFSSMNIMTYLLHNIFLNDCTEEMLFPIKMYWHWMILEKNQKITYNSKSSLIWEKRSSTLSVLLLIWFWVWVSWFLSGPPVDADNVTSK
jgi:hypothetical protein